MEDGATEAESIVHPALENPEKVDDVKEDGGKKGGGGLIDQILSNLVTKREADEEDMERGEKGGGIIDQIISTLVSPRADGPDKDKDRSFSVFRSEEHEQEDAEKVDEESKKGGGSIIGNIVSHFPKSLPDDAAPTTDEASILIHSIVHD